MAAKVHLRPSHVDSIKVHPFFRQQSKAFCQADFGFRILEKNPNDTSQITIKKNPLVDATDYLPCSHGASSSPNYTKKRKYRQKEAESAYDHSSEYYEYEEEKSEHVKVKKTKRDKTSKVHSLSERRRREKINKKMRILQDLIPNCSKVDKVSVLDEAIKYLKTLQIQLQMQILIMSMGSGMYMTPQIPMMMLPPGMHLARCSPMSMANSRMGRHLNVQPTPNTSPSPKSWPNQV